MVDYDYAYEAWPSGHPYDWSPSTRGHHPHDQIDFHVDLGCGRIKKGRIGIDHYEDPGVDIQLDLEDAWLPFEDSSINSIITHHCLEHIDNGFIPLMDECYRVLKDGALFRIIVPLFPSWTAVMDPDHRRYFMATEDPKGIGTFDCFCGTPGSTPNNCWLASFSTPYTNARFRKVAQDSTPRSADPAEWFTEKDQREMRLSLMTMK